MKKVRSSQAFISINSFIEMSKHSFSLRVYISLLHKVRPLTAMTGYTDGVFIGDMKVKVCLLPGSRNNCSFTADLALSTDIIG